MSTRHSIRLHQEEFNALDTISAYIGISHSQALTCIVKGLATNPREDVTPLARKHDKIVAYDLDDDTHYKAIKRYYGNMTTHALRNELIYQAELIKEVNDDDDSELI